MRTQVEGTVTKRNGRSNERHEVKKLKRTSHNVRAVKGWISQRRGRLGIVVDLICSVAKEWLGGSGRLGILSAFHQAEAAHIPVQHSDDVMDVNNNAAFHDELTSTYARAPLTLRYFYYCPGRSPEC